MTGADPQTHRCDVLPVDGELREGVATCASDSRPLFSSSAVAELAAEFDYLMRIAWKHREPVPGCMVARRRELTEYAAYARTYADLRINAPTSLGGSHFGPGVVDTKTAARELGHYGGWRARPVQARTLDGHETRGQLAHRQSLDR